MADYFINKAVAKKRKPTNREEDDLQRAICKLLRLLEAQARLYWFAVPNGGFRRKIEAAIMKGLGVRAGIPDLVILAKGRAYFMELKSSVGVLNDAQRIVIPALKRHGFPVVVIRTIDQAIEALKSWGLMSAREGGA
jgi:hypothetical protein